MNSRLVQAIGDFRLELCRLNYALFSMLLSTDDNPDKFWDMISDYIYDGEIIITNRAIPKLLTELAFEASDAPSRKISILKER